MTDLRVIDTGLEPARWNIAVTAALLELHRAGDIADTFRFHRYPRSVLVGRHQNLAGAVDTERCRRSGVEIARRITGGGAVYMSPTILAWELVAARQQVGASLGDAASRVGAMIAGGLGRLGLPAQATITGGIEIDGQKVGGSSGSFDGPTLLMQGTILIDFDRDEMDRMLKVHANAAGPAPRVARLADFLGRVPSVEEVRTALLTEMSVAWRTPIVIADLGPEELALAEALLASEIGAEEFVTGEASSTAMRRRTAGACWRPGCSSCSRTPTRAMSRSSARPSFTQPSLRPWTTRSTCSARRRRGS
jgi:lipoate-protein ligase A